MPFGKIMKLSISEIANFIGAEIEGDSSLKVHTISKIEEGQKGSITFLANPKYRPYLYKTQASAVIIPLDFVPEKQIDAVLLRVEDPYRAFSVLLEKVAEMLTDPPYKTISQQAYVSPSAQVGKDVYIGEFAFVGDGVVLEDNVEVYPFSYIGRNTFIGANTKIYPHVTIYHSCMIGKHCIFHSGVRIGADGFGFAPQEEGSYKKLLHIGRVVIQDFVEVGANTTIDRATMGETIVEKGVKLDNLIQVAHNVRIGEHTVIAGQAGIAGSTSMGANCMVGGQAGIVGHLKIANGTRIEAQSGVTSSILAENQAIRGTPATDYRKQIKSELYFRKIEEMYHRIVDLEEKIKAFESEKHE